MELWLMEFKLIIYEKSEGVATITLNRPEALNAFSKQVVEEVLRALEDVKSDENVHVVVLTGAGERAFSAGADIKAMAGMTALKARELSLMGESLCLALENLEKPVVAAINGYALGGGLEVAMACDLRIASENASMGQTEVNIGLIPGWGGTQRLTRLVGMMKAKELVFTGKKFDARTAEQLGIVNMVAPADKFRETVRQFALELASKPPVALKVAKAVINKGANIGLDSALALEREGFGVVASSEDFKEGVSAFTEKRKPVFKGK
jgi:enoyl-CoA hydratase/carnithine racemase